MNDYLNMLMTINDGINKESLNVRDKILQVAKDLGLTDKDISDILLKRVSDLNMPKEAERALLDKVKKDFGGNFH